MIAARGATRWHRGPEVSIAPDFVSLRAIPGPFSDADGIRKVCEALGWQVESIPPQLEKKVLIRGRAIFGPASEYFDRIAASYPNLYWSRRDGVLCFREGTPKQLEGPKAIVAPLVHRAKQSAKRGPKGRRILSKQEWLSIALALDNLSPKLDPLDCLEPSQKAVLSDYNRSGPRVHIHTWRAAISGGDRQKNKVRRAVQRWLNRCADDYAGTQSNRATDR